MYINIRVREYIRITAKVGDTPKQVFEVFIKHIILDSRSIRISMLFVQQWYIEIMVETKPPFFIFAKSEKKQKFVQFLQNFPKFCFAKIFALAKVYTNVFTKKFFVSAMVLQKVSVFEK
jgi:hypothetical protein